MYLSVCAGIEAATQAWAPLGWRPVAFSEIEPFPCAVLAIAYCAMMFMFDYLAALGARRGCPWCQGYIRGRTAWMFWRRK